MSIDVFSKYYLALIYCDVFSIDILLSLDKILSTHRRNIKTQLIEANDEDIFECTGIISYVYLNCLEEQNFLLSLLTNNNIAEQTKNVQLPLLFRWIIHKYCFPLKKGWPASNIFFNVMLRNVNSVATSC